MNITEASNRLGVTPSALWAVIQFESKHDPHARNPYTNAVGLIQFMDSASQDLGYKDKEDLYQNNQTYEKQLNQVVNWFERYGPYKDSGDLYLQVFYPAARNWDRQKAFPAHVQKVNPGIKTPQDYIDKVERIRQGSPVKNISGLLLILGAGLAMYILGKY